MWTKHCTWKVSWWYFSSETITDNGTAFYKQSKKNPPKLKHCLSYIKEEKKIRKREESHKVKRTKLPMGKSKSYYKVLITNLMISDLKINVIPV